jgi:hypothetical protein
LLRIALRCTALRRTASLPRHFGELKHTAPLSPCFISPLQNQGELASSTLSLTMTAVGSVVLSLPSAFAQCGWLAGAVILLVVAILMDISLVILAVRMRPRPCQASSKMQRPNRVWHPVPKRTKWRVRRHSPKRPGSRGMDTPPAMSAFASGVLQPPNCPRNRRRLGGRNSDGGRQWVTVISNAPYPVIFQG